MLLKGPHPWLMFPRVPWGRGRDCTGTGAVGLESGWLCLLDNIVAFNATLVSREMPGISCVLLLLLRAVPDPGPPAC